MERSVILAIDEFNSFGINGWIVSARESEYTTCPILIIKDKNEIKSVDSFNYRPDVEEANIGTGIFGFNVNLAIEPNSHVEIYEKHTGYKLWEGRLGKQWNKTAKLKFEIKEISPIVLSNAEACLNYISLSDESESNALKRKKIILYKMLLETDLGPIYYFQVLQRNNDESVKFSADGYQVSNRLAAIMDDYSLIEYFVVGKKMIKKNNGERIKSLKYSFLNSENNHSIPVQIINCHEDRIYIYCYESKCHVRPNLKMKLHAGKAMPVTPIAYNVYGNDFAGVNSNSIAYLKADYSLIWAPLVIEMFNSCNNEQLKNLLEVALIDSENPSSTIYFDLEGMLNYYKMHGSKILIEAMYMHLLQREADSDGLLSNLNIFNEQAEIVGIEVAIADSWSRFVNSEEFKSKKFRYVESPESENYVFKNRRDSLA